MEATTVIHLGMFPFKFKMSAQDAASVVLHGAGYDDIDIEPMGDYVMLTATGKMRAFSVRAETIDLVCERAIERIVLK